MSSKQLPSQYPVFNNKYNIIKSLGEGHTSKVYLGQDCTNSSVQVAIKVLKEEFLTKEKDAIKSVEGEIQILKNLKHAGIINLFEYGDQGVVEKPSGRVINNMVYLVLENVNGGLLFDVCQNLGAMGEDAGRFFATQMLDAMEYMHSNRVVHRDLKLENILVVDKLNLKLADFGFACYKNIDCLKSYRGTFTYMAPEIKEGRQYNGTQVDMFSFAVILFIIVQGIFPFKEARTEEYFYNLICTGQLDLYFQKTNGTGLSNEFKDLIIALFAFDGSKRPSISQIRQHPWLNNSSFNFEATRAKLLSDSRLKVADDAKPLTKPAKVSRKQAV
jgi:serine/threonine protein kinase